MSIVVTAPTGHIGSRVTQKLLDAGLSIVIVHRDPAKVKNFADQGAKVVKGSFYDDRKVVEESLTGCKTLFFMIPPINGPEYDKWSVNATKMAAEVAKEKGVERVVFLSSLFAQVGAGTGILTALRDCETALESKLRNVVNIRAGFFFENTLRDIPTVISQGKSFNPLHAATKRWPYVAVSDVADAIVSYLFTDNWQGQSTIGVHGPKDYTLVEAIGEISKAVGTPITPIPVPIADFKTAEFFNTPPFVVNAIAEFFEAIISGRAFPAEVRTPLTTFPTTLHEWAKTVYKPALESAKSQKK